MKVEGKNILKAVGIWDVERGVPSPRGRLDVIHILMVDPEETVHLVALATRPNYTEGLLTALARTVAAIPLRAEDVEALSHAAPVLPLPAGEEMVRIRRGKEDGDAQGEGIHLDPAAGDRGGEGAGEADSLGAGIPGRPPGEV